MTDTEVSLLQRFVAADLKAFRSLVVPGIFALINFGEKKIDIRHSHNCLQSIARHATELELGTHPCKQLLADKEKLEIQILETVEDYQARLLCHTLWCNIFLDEGFAFYRLRKALTYTPKIVIEDYEARVRLYNKNHDSFVVGCFTSMVEAEAFVAKYYGPETKTATPVYASNELTSGYMRNASRMRTCE